MNIETFNKLKEEIPYLISMVVSDVSSMIPVVENDGLQSQDYNIKKPKNEPVIGVIDTLFNRNVYFSEWVEYQEVLEFY